MNSGRKIIIPTIHLSSRQMPNIRIKVNKKPIEGRPKVIIKKMIDLGFENGWFEPTIIEDLIEHGFDRGYWNDLPVFLTPFIYFLQDRGWKWSKEKRLEEVNENGIRAEKRI